ncbi:LysR family transcriptional regulator [Aquimarina sp. AD10]|uniref:LysR substrate-binding domain-containing protein n=1 Tax=Aquimarina sp. AD10 TaxID=1714849 RepID=UPI000E48E5F7|nr:LysR substrate-binding domain-containing protein [Aquimarina sp. AD10]AXT59762.1 LysR family transcriptional regulator [Aquimarina sp. AD10]RKM97632.1 LysR family transcriptional regulator [Aquimarina sp. AD10]
MTIQQLKNVIVLSEKLNFTRAAEELNIVQPALSRQIKQLEEEIGIVIFKRDKRNVEHTTAGIYFIKEIKKLLSQFDRINAQSVQIHNGKAGEIRIGFTHSIMQTILPEILKTINKKTPDIKAVLKEMNNRDQYLALQQNELDIGFATNPMVPFNLKSKILHIDNFVVLLPDHHPVNENNYIDFSVFAKEEFIFPTVSDGPNYVHILESICVDAGFTPKVVHETDSASTSFRLIEAGLGITLEPISSLHGHEFPIKSIELKNIKQKAKLTMMWNPERESEYPELFELLKNWKVN